VRRWDVKRISTASFSGPSVDGGNPLLSLLVIRDPEMDNAFLLRGIV
jgi:hypothetical protein